MDIGSFTTMTHLQKEISNQCPHTSESLCYSAVGGLDYVLTKKKAALQITWNLVTLQRPEEVPPEPTSHCCHLPKQTKKINSPELH